MIDHNSYLIMALKNLKSLLKNLESRESELRLAGQTDTIKAADMYVKLIGTVKANIAELERHVSDDDGGGQ